MSYDQIPQSELDIFKSLDVKVVFDVGARDDTDYLEIKPDIELHAFEPNVEFFNKLKAKIGDKPNVYLNNYGLGDEEGVFGYSDAVQAFEGGEADTSPGTHAEYPIKTLDWYVDQNDITEIDFLKIDAEGYDYKILMGGLKAIQMCKYIQYEHWADKERFHQQLERDFIMSYIGGRNVLCKRK